MRRKIISLGFFISLFVGLSAQTVDTVSYSHYFQGTQNITANSFHVWGFAQSQANGFLEINRADTSRSSLTNILFAFGGGYGINPYSPSKIYSVETGQEVFAIDTELSTIGYMINNDVFVNYDYNKVFDTEGCINLFQKNTGNWTRKPLMKGSIFDFIAFNTKDSTFEFHRTTSNDSIFSFTVDGTLVDTVVNNDRVYFITYRDSTCLKFSQQTYSNGGWLLYTANNDTIALGHLDCSYGALSRSGNDLLVTLIVDRNGTNKGHIYQIEFNDYYVQVTGINNVSTEQIKVYPNPANDFISVIGNDNSVVKIYDIHGRLVKTSNSSVVNVSDLSEGIYILKAKDKTSKFIIKK